MQQRISLLMESDDLVPALHLLRRVLKIKKHHMNAAPFTSVFDVADAHVTIASVLDEIITRLSSTSGEQLKAKYVNESAWHYFSAYEIKCDMLGSDDPNTQEALRLFYDKF